MSKTNNSHVSQPTISKFFSSRSQQKPASKAVQDNVGVKRPQNLESSGPDERGPQQKKRRASKGALKETVSSENTSLPKVQGGAADVHIIASPKCVSENTRKKLEGFSAAVHCAAEVSGKAQNVEIRDLKKPVCHQGYGSVIGTGPSSVMTVDSDDEQLQTKQDKYTKNYNRHAPLSKFSNNKKSGLSNSGEPSRSSRSKNKYTPLELQVLDIKDIYPDAILLIECGYKYRFFGDDAEIAAKELNIFAHPDHNFMTASIPVHRLFVHVRRLVAKGYKVGVVKQMETAALKAAGDNRNTPFTRQLTALYTKTTLIGEDVDPVDSSRGDANEGVSASSSSSFLMCVFEPTQQETKGKSHTIAIVAIQPATGDVVYDCFEDGPTRAELETRVTQIQPAELLLPSTLSPNTDKILTQLAKVSYSADDRMRVERQDDGMFSPHAAIKGLADLFIANTASESDSSGKGKGEGGLSEMLQLPQPVVCCLHGLMVYLREFNLHHVLCLTSNFREFSCRDMYMHLPASTLRNLEVFNNLTDGKVKGSLIWILDHTCTKFGGRLLRQWLAKPLMDVKALNARLDAVSELISADAAILCKLLELLPKLPDLERGLTSVLHRKSSTAEFLAVCKALQLVHQTLQPFTSSPSFNLQSALLTKILAELPGLLDGIQEWIGAVHEKAAKEGDKTELFVDESSYPGVVECKQGITEVLSELIKHKREVRKILHQPSLEYNTVSGTEFLVEVRNNQLNNVPGDWSKISSTKIVSRFHSPFIVSSMKKLSQLRERLSIESNSAWLEFLQSFEDCYPRYRQAVNLLAQFDCLVSMATVAKQEGFCRPELVEGDSQIHIEQGRHPVVAALLDENAQYVPNDTHLQASCQRCMIITGPNMGGKSSYIRQVALITILAQVGSYVPAECATVGLVDAIYTRMGAFDELFQGRSTFMVELQEASEIIAKATPRSLVIMDELGRGTSTHDGVAIAQATLAHFVKQVKCMTLFVTHYPSLAELEEAVPDHVSNFHMSFFLLDQDSQGSGENDNQLHEQGGDGHERITFLYQLVAGMAGRSYGLNVAQLANLPSEVVSLATKKSRELEDTINLKRKYEEFFRQLFCATASEFKDLYGRMAAELESDCLTEKPL